MLLWEEVAVDAIVVFTSVRLDDRIQACASTLLRKYTPRSFPMRIKKVFPSVCLSVCLSGWLAVRPSTLGNVSDSLKTAKLSIVKGTKGIIKAT